MERSRARVATNKNAAFHALVTPVVIGIAFIVFFTTIFISTVLFFG
jgi:hypothetical protein